MKIETKNRKNAMPGFRQITQQEKQRQTMHEILQTGAQALNELSLELGRQLAQFILYAEREELSGPDYQPSQKGLQKWASEPGSVYLGGQKVRIERPRLRRGDQEVQLKSYQAMRQKNGFSDQLLAGALGGLSARRYRETLVKSAQAFGVSPSAISERLVEATARELKTFKERRLEDFTPLAVFIDTVHRGGQAFVVALGLDTAGKKRALGFWEGASENADTALALLADLEARGLRLSAKILFIVDGGKGVIKALKDRFGAKLLLQRCAIHKDRNLQAHLPKKHRKEAHRRYRIALEQNDYKEAEKLLKELEKWLRGINESAADSLLEAFNELLTLHRLKAPALLRKTLYSTNPIESLFSRVRHCERNIKRYRNSSMRQRWLGSVLLYAEKSFRAVKGHEEIQQLLKNIEEEQTKTSE
jgi:transposase-like protein